MSLSQVDFFFPGYVRPSFVSYSFICRVLLQLVTPFFSLLSVRSPEYENMWFAFFSLSLRLSCYFHVITSIIDSQL